MGVSPILVSFHLGIFHCHDYGRKGNMEPKHHTIEKENLFQAWIFRGVNLRLELLPAHIGSVDFPSLGGVISYSFFIIFQHSWCKAPGRPNIGVKMKIYPSDHGNLPDLL